MRETLWAETSPPSAEGWWVHARWGTMIVVDRAMVVRHRGRMVPHRGRCTGAHGMMARAAVAHHFLRTAWRWMLGQVGRPRARERRTLEGMFQRCLRHPTEQFGAVLDAIRVKCDGCLQRALLRVV